MALNCIWSLYDNETNLIIGGSIFVAGILSTFYITLAVITFLKFTLGANKSHLLLLNLCVALLIRNVFAGYLLSGSSAMSGSWILSAEACEIYGFVNHFLFVYQIEALTHLCIERYVLAKYFMNGWEVKKSNYSTFIGLCWFFAILYSVPMLYGLGSYTYDYTCTACTLNLVLPTELWRKCLLLAILFLQSVKPVIVMLCMLNWALGIERDHYDKEKQGDARALTESTFKLTCVMLLFWLPSFICTAYVVYSQLFKGIVAAPPLGATYAAALFYEATPAAVAITIYWTNETVRQAGHRLFWTPTETPDQLIPKHKKEKNH